MTIRYAIYYAPARESALWRFGSSVLGYDAWSGQSIAPIVPPGFSRERWHEVTADPRVYGFHATLKAPFRLAEGQSEEKLLQAADDFARRRSPVLLAGLAVMATPSSRPGAFFLALRETEPSEPLQQLERACVTAFEPFRAPHSAEEKARRPLDGMSPRQAQQFEAYGYPFIFEDFRFHMTLSRAIAGEELDAARRGLAERFAEDAPAGPAKIDRIALFRQAGAGARFTIISEHVFAVEPETKAA